MTNKSVVPSVTLPPDDRALSPLALGGTVFVPDPYSGARGNDLLATMGATPLDFLGVNYYSRAIVHDPAGEPGKIINRRNPVNFMARGWEVYPQGLSDLLTWLHKDYAFPTLIITENGATYDDVVWEGQVHDLMRLDYIKQHIAILPDLIAAGVPLTGYFCWTLLDNFEWATGARDRFGLAYTDFQTQQRIIKDSGHWYRRVTQANAVVD